MSKEFVPYELAIKLKQLGFDEPCFATYDEDKEFEIQDFEQNYDTFPSHIIAAPLYQQAFRFFRENHDLYINVTRYNDEGEDKFLYYIDSGDVEEEFNTYEEAELACLNKLIEIVKSKQL